MAAGGSTIIGAEAAAFLRGSVSAFLGTVDAMGTPDATRVLGIAAVDDRRLRLLISARAETARANAQVGAKVAVIVTDITTYRSVQWKGRVEAVSDTHSPGDTVLIDHHVRSFRDGCAVVGLEPADAWKLFPLDGVPITVVVEESYDQTPGANAGTRISSSA